ncbi:MAG: LacI family DNA-binding transcriptional regulator [Fimbriimonas sp.]|nr:LacI family DNA-binding transcriptional regulator [Fimbriimonas sp.]
MVTLKDIAKASGVSTATVSYVLNDGPRPVLPATREKVQRVIDEFGYKPSAAARSLRRARTATFGVVFPHEGIDPFENEYFAEVLSGVLRIASEHKQVLMLFTGMSWTEVEQNVPTFCDGRCDGFLFLAPPANSTFLLDLAKQNKNLVLLGTRAWGIPVSTVDCDNVLGGRLATRRLIELGHRKIGMITADNRSTSSPERLAGFRSEMADAGIEVDESLIVEGFYNQDGSAASARTLLDRRRETGLSAVFCAHDSVAEALLRVAKRQGVRVPEDLSVIGFDDLGRSARMDPPLTTVHHPLRLIGATAATRLLELVENSSLEVEEQLFDVYLVERHSTAPLGSI